MTLKKHRLMRRKLPIRISILDSLAKSGVSRMVDRILSKKKSKLCYCYLQTHAEDVNLLDQIGFVGHDELHQCLTINKM